MKTNAPINADPRRCQHKAAPTIFEATGKSLSGVIIAVAWGFFAVAISGYLYFDAKKYFEHLWTNPDAYLILGLGFGLGICGLIISGILIAIIQEQLRIATELDREIITALGMITDKWVNESGEACSIGYQFSYMGSLWVGTKQTLRTEYDQRQIGDSVKIRFLPLNPSISRIQ